MCSFLMTLLILCHFFPFFLAYLPHTITLPNHRATIFFLLLCVFYSIFLYLFPKCWRRCTQNTHTRRFFFLGGKKTTIYSAKAIYMKIHYVTLIYDYVHFWYLELVFFRLFFYSLLLMCCVSRRAAELICDLFLHITTNSPAFWVNERLRLSV